MKIITLCFMLIYCSIFGYCAIAQVIDQYQQNDRLKFTNFQVENRNGKLNFKWDVSNQAKCRYFELERSDSADYFKVIALAFPFENNQDSVYKYYEYIRKNSTATSFFRIKALMENDSAIYSAVVSPASK
jgi:hypothetical protein